MPPGWSRNLPPQQTLMQFRKYSIELYSELGLFDHVGSLRVASTRDQFTELQRSVSRAKAIGMDVEIISPAEAVQASCPRSARENLYGAIYLPRDGHLDPYTHHHRHGALRRASWASRSTPIRVSPASSSRPPAR